jgi:hypothetical protein
MDMRYQRKAKQTLAAMLIAAVYSMQLQAEYCLSVHNDLRSIYVRLQHEA